MFENPRFSNIHVFDIHYLGFFKSKFSIFTIGEYRKHGFIKVGEIKSAISEKSAFSTWPFYEVSLQSPWFSGILSSNGATLELEKLMVVHITLQVAPGR